MSGCTDKRLGDMLYAYELGMLDHEDQQALEMHLYECDECFEKAGRFQKTARLLRSSERVRETVSELAESETEQRRLEPLQTPSAPPRKSLWARLAPTLAAAAVLVLLIGQPWQFYIKPYDPAIAAQNRLAIMRFDNLQNPDDDQKLGEIAANLLMTDLSESHFVQVISSQRLNDICNALIGEDITGEASGDFDSEVARCADARWMLKGTILQEDPRLVVTSQLVDVASGNTVAAQRVTGNVGDDIFAIIDRLTVEVKNDLSLPEEAFEEPDYSVKDVTTHSHEAYRYYIEGLDFLSKVFRREALESFEKAVEIDSSFAMAYYHLSRYAWGARRDSLVAKAVAYSDKVSQRERYYIMVLDAMVEGDTNRVIDQRAQLLERYPDDYQAWLDQGGWYWVREQYHESRDCYQRVLDIDPENKLAYNMLAYVYNALGDTVKCLEMLDRYAELAPDEPNPWDSRGEILLQQGRVEEAIESLKKSLAIKPDFGASANTLLDIYLDLKRYDEYEAYLREQIATEGAWMRTRLRRFLAFPKVFQGELTEALAILDDILATETTDSTYEELPNVHNLKAFIYRELDMPEKAVESIRKASSLLTEIREIDSTSNFRHRVVQLLAEAGRFEEADSLCSVLGPDVANTEDHGQWAVYAQACLQLARGDTESAVTSFQAVVDSSGHYSRPRFMLARTLQQTGRHKEALEQFSKVLDKTLSTRYYHPIVWVKTHYYMAVSLEEMGREDDAQAMYEEFLSLWGDADFRIDEVAIAKQRLAALSSGA